MNSGPLEDESVARTTLPLPHKTASNKQDLLLRTSAPSREEIKSFGGKPSAAFVSPNHVAINKNTQNLIKNKKSCPLRTSSDYFAFPEQKQVDEDKMIAKVNRCKR